MNFQVATSLPTTVSGSIYLIADNNTSQIISQIKANHPSLQSIHTDSRLNTDYLSVSTFRDHDSNQYVITVGLGKPSSTAADQADKLDHAVATGCRRAQSIKLDTISLHGAWVDESISEAVAMRLAQAVVMGTYAFTAYKSDPKDSHAIQAITLVVNQQTDTPVIAAAFQAGQVTGLGVNTARDLANTPANDLNPTTFIEKIQATFGSDSDFSVEIIDEAKAKAYGMNCLLAVGQGSPQPSALGIVRYTGNKQHDKTVALVGKGITFDTGGISLKPSGNMKEMKGDMSGAAAVFGALSVIKDLRPAVNVLGIIALAENMPSGDAQRPGDVIKAYNGTAVEIVNTDAEGRLVLADALAYAVKQKPALIVDIATLTGAAMVALGREAMAIMGNHASAIALVKQTQTDTGERVWELPLYDSFKDYLKSDIADIAHCSEGRWGGTCTAAKFLEQFVSDVPWVHIDMAPQMANTKTVGANVKGMSGAGTRSLVAIVMQAFQSKTL